MLAEAVSLDGGTILVLLVVAFLVLVATIAVVVFGFILAPRAGRGSQSALAWWGIIVALEGLYVLRTLGGLLRGYLSPSTFVVAAIIAGQVALFLRARRDLEK